MLSSLPTLIPSDLTSSSLDTSERPFHCSHCNVGFPRSDVKENHVKRCHPSNSSPANVSGSPTPQRQSRSKLACDQCRSRKLKCDNSHPCNSCRVKQLPCTISSSSRPAGRPRNSQPRLVPHDTSHTDVNDSVDTSTAPVSWAPGGSESDAVVGFILTNGASLLDASSWESTAFPLTQEIPQQADGLLGNADENFIDPEVAVFTNGTVNTQQGWNDVELMDGLWQVPLLVRSVRIWEN